MDGWPNLFLVGAPKCGTSSMHAYLGQLPGVFMSQIKEPNYFSRTVVPDDDPSLPIRDQATYLRLFATAGDAQIRGESSTTYLLDPGAPSAIQQLAPDARILVMLRDPVDLAFSFWLMRRRQEIAAGFLEEVQARLDSWESDWTKDDLKLEFGFFADSLSRYLEAFPERQVHVLVFEEFERDPDAALREVAGFLGVGYESGSIELKAYNAYGEPRGPWTRMILGNAVIFSLAQRLTTPAMRNWVRQRILLKPSEKPMMDRQAESLLVDLYADDVSRVRDILGRDLPWRRFAA